MDINLILYSNNEPYNTTKKLTIDSVNHFTKNKIIIHDYNLEIIKSTPWFYKIENLPYINKKGKRDGYYNSWKAFITKEVYDKANEGDIIYYVDSSQYYRSGFTENIDKLCECAYKIGFIAGSVGNNVNNNSYSCCDNIDIWNIIIPNNNNNVYLKKMHVLNSWFILKKHTDNDLFINEWVYFSCYKDDTLKDPLVTYHHTGDQSIFNILVYKHNLSVFYDETIDHDTNKNKNIVLKILNDASDVSKFFIKL